MVFSCRQTLRGRTAVEFNRRMRKTARPVVWEPWRAQSRQGDPIGGCRWEELDAGVETGAGRLLRVGAGTGWGR